MDSDDGLDEVWPQSARRRVHVVRRERPDGRIELTTERELMEQIDAPDAEPMLEVRTICPLRSPDCVLPSAPPVSVTVS
jgi:hypothetical protein